MVYARVRVRADAARARPARDHGDTSRPPRPGSARATPRSTRSRTGSRASKRCVARDEEVLRKLLALLVEKGVATREEILERIK